MSRAQLVIREADLQDPEDSRALVAIIDCYAREPGGQNAPLSAHAREALAPGLQAHPAAFALLAWRASFAQRAEGERSPEGGFAQRAEGERSPSDWTAVGAAVCVWGFSTFTGCPSLNVHDLAVLPDHRGRGVGRRLLEEAERRARVRGSSKLTLEVHATNEAAIHLYRRFGFGPWDTPTLFVTKPLPGSPS
jgi:ribosomal protein S18 acetylase RimI-like enzyme